MQYFRLLPPSLTLWSLKVGTVSSVKHW